MKILLVDNGTTLLEKLKLLVPGEEEVVRFDNLKNKNPEDFDLTMLSGGSQFPLIGNEDKFLEELIFVKKTTKPLVGICLGFELIAEAFDGKLRKLDSQTKGIKEIEILDSDFYKKLVIKVYESHQWVVEKLPNDFIILAQSLTGPEIIKHKILPIYGFQFHPENLVEESDGDEIFLQLFEKFAK